MFSIQATVVTSTFAFCQIHFGRPNLVFLHELRSVSTLLYFCFHFASYEFAAAMLGLTRSGGDYCRGGATERMILSEEASQPRRTQRTATRERERERHIESTKLLSTFPLLSPCCPAAGPPVLATGTFRPIAWPLRSEFSPLPYSILQAASRLPFGSTGTSCGPLPQKSSSPLHCSTVVGRLSFYSLDCTGLLTCFALVEFSGRFFVHSYPARPVLSDCLAPPLRFSTCHMEIPAVCCSIRFAALLACLLLAFLEFFYALGF